MKKAAIILLLVALVALLTGCGNKDPFPGVRNPVATITLSDDSVMRFELFVQEAPNTVANFIQLAQSGFYNDLPFFRVVPGVLIQSGCKNGNGTGMAGHVIQGEFELNGIENDLSHVRGTISMSRQSDYDTASSQFFIMQGSYSEYDGRYAAFGRAMDDATLAAIDKVASVSIDARYKPIGGLTKIKSIAIETYGKEYIPATLPIPKNED
ncbi:MAG: peptidylprolyl isomerase [Clostridia bacterium]|nr:peptidylprolyl isomerase [Clostridia bacterium]